jgi:site-specific DNA recombinase
MRKPRHEGSSSIEPEAEAKRAHRGSSRKATLEAPPNLAGGRKIRCAIYTRKSSEEGLEQEFNSLDAQREACEAFVRSQKHEGWSVLSQLYDDPGYSGGTMERPALKRLLADIAAHRIDAVVVYKVDRLTRSLSDFAKIVEVFDAHSVSFVSITQAFNTTTSMGRLTLNVLLSFAQFEREVTGERIRDKIAASKKKGLWMGGQPSLGYDVKDRKLVVNEAEALTVRMIFRRYLELGSVRALKAALDEESVVSKRRTAADGSPYGGKSFSRGALYLMLQNRVYRGEIVHKGASYRGEHAPIIEEELWTSVQRRLEANGVERREGQAPAKSNLLTGVLFDAEGQPMTPTHAVKRGVRYRYYVSRGLITGTKGDEGNGQTLGQRIPAVNLEGLVVQRLRSFFADPAAVLESLPQHLCDAPSQKRATEATMTFVRALEDRREDAWETIFRPMIARVQARLDRIDIDLSAERLVERLLQTNNIDSHFGEVEGDFTPRRADDDSDSTEAVVRLSLPAQLKRTGKEMKFVVHGDGAGRSADPSLVRLIVRAHKLTKRLAETPGSSLEDVASQQNMGGPYAARLIRLNYLAPDIVAAILDGKQPVDLTATKLMADTRLPLDWRAQRAALGFA